MIARLPPLILAVCGLVIISVFTQLLMGEADPTVAPWWETLFILLLAIAVSALGLAVTIAPTDIATRRALAGSGLALLVILAGVALVYGAMGVMADTARVMLLVSVGLIVALWGVAATTRTVTNDTTADFGRVGAVIGFGGAILTAAAAIVVVVSLARALARTLATGHGLERLPWGLVIAIIVIPVVTFVIAAIGTRRATGGTFHAQAASNRRNSILLMISLVGVVAATAEIIAVSITFDPIPTLWAAGIAAVVGLGAAFIGNRIGADVILQTAGARRADPKHDAVLIDVVQELSIAANVPMPAVYVITDGSQNAFATGRDPMHASLAVTTGLVERMDREQLQGVIGHELGHIRNLDTRFALYVAVLVGLVALVTDGFLQVVVEGWKQGAFFWKSDDKSVVATLAMGVLVGLFLLVVAALLRLVAPLFSALVQASTSREREYLADATAVEFTRNPRALERALTSLAGDDDTLDAANRGTQHLWFRNPVKPGSDRGSGLFATHPSLGARIDRLRVLQGLAPLKPEALATRET